MIEGLRALLGRTLPLRLGLYELLLAEPPAVNDDGDPTVTLRGVIRDGGGFEDDLEQTVVLLQPHADRDVRGAAAIEGWCRALPDLWLRHPTLRFNLYVPITPDEIVASDLLARSSATTAEDFAAFLLGPESPFVWARRTARDRDYRKLLLPAGADLRDGLWSHLPDEACSLSFEWRNALLEYWILPPRHAYHALRAICDLGSSGFEGYLEQADAREVRGVYEALLALPSLGLARAMRSALAKMQEQGSAEYLTAGDEGALETIEAIAKGESFPETWREIDHHDEGGTYHLISKELEPAFDAFIVEHRDDLVTPAP